MKEKKLYKSLIISVFIIAAAVAIGGYVAYTTLTDGTEETVVEEEALGGKVEVEAAQQIDLESLRYTVGDSAYTLVVYLDPQDEKSRQYLTAVREAIPDQEGSIAYSVKHFPTHVHPTARDEAGAIECAGQQGKFFEYMDTVFAQSEAKEAIPEDVLTGVATELELDEEAFAICRDEEEFHEAVRDDALEAMSVGALGTPHSVIIDRNGLVLQRIEGLLPADVLAVAINNTVLVDDAIETRLEE